MSAIAVIFGLLMINIVFPILSLFPPRLYSTEQDLDLSTGRTRHTRYVLFCRTKSEVQETALSEALRGMPPVGKKTWGRISISSPAGVKTSAHPAYLYVYRYMCEMEMVWEREGYDRDVRVKTATQFLRLAQTEDGRRACGVYVDYLKLDSIKRTSTQPVVADDIPDDLVERALSGDLEEYVRAEYARRFSESGR